MDLFTINRDNEKAVFRCKYLNDSIKNNKWIKLGHYHTDSVLDYTYYTPIMTIPYSWASNAIVILSLGTAIINGVDNYTRFGAKLVDIFPNPVTIDKLIGFKYTVDGNYCDIDVYYKTLTSINFGCASIIGESSDNNKFNTIITFDLLMQQTDLTDEDMGKIITL